MSKARYTYETQVFSVSTWVTVASGSRGYCTGFFHAHAEHPSPRLASRLVRSDGVVLDERKASEGAALGMVAGFPSPEQYERAAAKAQASADLLRKRASSRAAIRKRFVEGSD